MNSQQRGSIAVEFAFVMLLLVPLSFGVTEYGRAIYQYNAIAKGVRDGVRYLSQYAPGDRDRISKAQCLAVFGSIDCNGSVLVPGLTTSMVAVMDSSTDAATCKLQSTGRGAVNLVTVEVRGYPFSSMAAFLVPNLTFGTIGATMVQTL